MFDRIDLMELLFDANFLVTAGVAVALALLWWRVYHLG